MYSQISKEELKKLIAPLLEDEHVGFVEITYIQTGGAPILRLLVDKEGGGITLDECASLNRKISDLLETHNIINNSYILEVSSPGLDRPLVTKSDFLRCKSRKIKFFLKDPINGKRELEGIIKTIDEQAIEIEIEGQIFSTPLSNISKAKQIIDDF